MTDSSTVTDRTAILTAARSFADAVAQTPAVSGYAAAVDAVRADTVALQLLQDTETARRTLQMNSASSGDSADRRLTELEAQVAQNPVLQRFFAGQQELIQQLQSINTGLTEALGFDFAALARPACSCG